eukprot:UC4_evm7s543
MSCSISPSDVQQDVITANATMDLTDDQQAQFHTKIEPSHEFSGHSSSYTLFGTTPYTPEERQAIQFALGQYMSPDDISFRDGGGNQKVPYLQFGDAVRLAHRCFGFNGWSLQIKRFETDYLNKSRKNKNNCDVAVSAIVRITLKDGSYHEDIGFGTAENMSRPTAAIEKAKKQAVSDGMKRALRQYGPALGSCLADSNFTKYIKPRAREARSKRDPNIRYQPSENSLRYVGDSNNSDHGDNNKILNNSDLECIPVVHQLQEKDSITTANRENILAKVPIPILSKETTKAQESSANEIRNGEQDSKYAPNHIPSGHCLNENVLSLGEDDAAAAYAMFEDDDDDWLSQRQNKEPVASIISNATAEKNSKNEALLKSQPSGHNETYPLANRFRRDPNQKN